MDEYRAETGEPFVPFTHLVTVAQTVGEDVDAAEMLAREGTRRQLGIKKARAGPLLRPHLGRRVGARVHAAAVALRGGEERRRRVWTRTSVNISPPSRRS